MQFDRSKRRESSRVSAARCLLRAQPGERMRELAYLHGARQPFDNAGSRMPEGNASRRRTMKHTKAYLLTLPVVLSIAGFASSAWAQDNAGGDTDNGYGVR